MAFERGNALLESLGDASRHGLGNGDRPPDGAAAGGAQLRTAEKTLRSSAGDSRGESTDDFSRQPRHSSGGKEFHWQLPPRGSRTLRVVERRAAVLQEESREFQ